MDVDTAILADVCLGNSMMEIFFSIWKKETLF